MKTILALLTVVYIGHNAVSGYEPNKAQTTSDLEKLEISTADSLSPDEAALQASIDQNQAKINEIQAELSALQNNTEAIVPKADNTGMVAPSKNGQATQEMDSAVKSIDAAIRMTPTVAIAMANNFSKHGIYAFVYDDPATKSVTDKFGEVIGEGIRHLSQSAAKDMVETN